MLHFPALWSEFSCFLTITTKKNTIIFAQLSALTSSSFMNKKSIAVVFHVNKTNIKTNTSFRVLCLPEISWEGLSSCNVVISLPALHNDPARLHLAQLSSHTDTHHHIAQTYLPVVQIRLHERALETGLHILNIISVLEDKQHINYDWMLFKSYSL